MNKQKPSLVGNPFPTRMSTSNRLARNPYCAIMNSTIMTGTKMPAARPTKPQPTKPATAFLLGFRR